MAGNVQLGIIDSFRRIDGLGISPHSLGIHFCIEPRCWVYSDVPADPSFLYNFIKKQILLNAGGPTTTRSSFCVCLVRPIVSNLVPTNDRSVLPLT